MAKPCAHCRSTKTRPAHGWQDRLLKAFGWRVRQCSDCGRLRLVPSAVVEADRAARAARAARHRDRRRRNESMPAVASPSAPADAHVVVAPAVAPPAANDPEGEDESELTLACPYCGATKTSWSKRSRWERMLRRGRMMRCHGCRRRFPMEKGRPTTTLA